MDIPPTEIDLTDDQQPQWRPLDRNERRVLGVLVEKSKMTPDIYPMTINAITTASNQKSNRKPLLQLDADDVEDALVNLRAAGAVAEIHGDGRAIKYKHKLYSWMGVERAQLAVMAELLLRGEQTLGDLRARASRMEKIADQNELRPIVDDLISKNLVIALTPPGRGQMVTHNLYLPEQLAKLEQEFGNAVQSQPQHERPERIPSPAVANVQADAELENRVAELEQTVAQLTSRLEQIETLLQ